MQAIGLRLRAIGEGFLKFQFRNFSFEKIHFLTASLPYAFGITFIQWFWVYSLSGFRLLKFAQWDGEWFYNIYANGYSSSFPPVITQAETSFSNVGFFPGYPYLAKAVGTLFFIGSPYFALILTSGMAALLFWSAYLSVLKKTGLSRGKIQICILAMLLHPGAYYMVCAYSEPVLCATLMVIIYLSQSGFKNWNSVFLGSVSGFLLSATKLVGGIAGALFCIQFAFLKSIQDRLQKGAFSKMFLLKTFLVIALGSLGAISFFVYCELKFGRWDIYNQTVLHGWNVYFLNENIFGEHAIRRYFTGYIYSLTNIDWFGKMFFTLHFPLFAATLVSIVTTVKKKNWPLMTAMCLTAIAIAEAIVIGRSSKDFHEFSRYLFIVTALILPVVMNLPLPRILKSRRIVLFTKGVLVSLGVTFFIIQSYLIYRFTHGFWVG